MQGEEKAFLIGLPLDPNQVPSPPSEKQVHLSNPTFSWTDLAQVLWKRKKKKLQEIFL